MLAHLLLVVVTASSAAEPGAMRFAIPDASFTFDGPVGERVRNNIEQWLIPAPAANPGIIDMMRRRDRQPVPQLVPWAGEFVGKYLLGAVAALRMGDSPRLQATVEQVVADLLATQADDGYLGPFRREERLLGHWDLWGHEHVLLALVMWHEQTGDRAALDAACRAADLICRTFLDGDKRAWDAGSHEMNLAVIHALGRLYHLTQNERYLPMMHAIVQDWEKPPAGDYLRTGLAHIDFHRGPKPRWESLPDLQGLIELWRITGDERYRDAFVWHWRSIRAHDRHPDGGFTTGEQAVGNPYSDGAIETCCTIAWMALTVDMLRLTGDPQAADELELTFWNGVLGAQHPSGRWWTYNTPINGVREASAHTIVFQARAGTPEFNCCSANAPRGLGMLTEWAVLSDGDGPVVNYYGPGTTRVPLDDGTHVTLRQETSYPAEPTVALLVDLPAPRRLPISLRIPRWSRNGRVLLNGQAVAQPVVPGRYLRLDREWRSGDRIDLTFDFTLRHWSGELSKTGQAALYRGPLLLAFDPALNAFDCGDIPTLDLRDLAAEPVAVDATFEPLVALRLAAGGREMVLCDFATAGATGTDYRAWLPATGGLPPDFHLVRPADGEAVAPGGTRFEWTGYRGSAHRFRFEIARTIEFADPLFRLDGLTSPRVTIREPLPADEPLYWRVVSSNEAGETVCDEEPHLFRIDPALPPLPPEALVEPLRGPGELLVEAALAGTAEPSFGRLERAVDVEPADGPGAEGSLRFSGGSSKLVYAIDEFPSEDYTAMLWACPEAAPAERLQELFSAWAVGGDDPLRIVLQNGRVHARIEGAGYHGTDGVPLDPGRWYHLAAAKEGDQLRLYVDGEPRQVTRVPVQVFSSARNVGVGCNPNYPGNETFAGRLAGFTLHARALSAAEVAAAAGG